MTKQNRPLQLVFPENLKRGANLSTTPRLTFDDLGGFIEEREKVKRAIATATSASLKIDYSNFSNHVFFDSAEAKFNIAKDKLLNQFPFNGTLEEKDAFYLTSSDYENHIYNTWPSYVGYADFNGVDHHISASDVETALHIGTSSLYVSAWASPQISDENVVISHATRKSNFILFSNDFDNPAWTPLTRLTVAAYGGLDPLGGTGSFVLQEDATASSSHFLRDGYTLPVNTYRVSFYAKAANRDWITFQYDAGNRAYWDVKNGVVGTPAGNLINPKIESVGNGWYRCSCDMVIPVETLYFYYFLLAEADLDAVFDGLAQDSTYVFGLQIEVLTNEGTGDLIQTSGSSVDYSSGYYLYFSGSVDPHVKFDFLSGSELVSLSAAYTDYTASFNNVAAIYDKPAQLASLYINDQLVDSGSVVYGSLEASAKYFVIGSGSRYDFSSSSLGFYSGSINEVRVALTASDAYHKKNYSREIDSEEYLKLHYSFNEGITGISSVDQITVDYSKSGLHGKIFGYDSAVRISGSTMRQDDGGPILYSFHPDLPSFTGSILLSASLYDLNNNNNITTMIPEGILYEDEQADLLYSFFTSAMARYFDELKLYVDQFDNLRVVNYENVNDTPDLMLPLLQRYFGWKVTEHFGDTELLSFFFGENVLSTGSLDTSLQEIRTQFWRRILLNIPYLLKTRGKRHNLDSFFNTLGIGQENINLKEYGYLPGGSIQDTRINRNKVTPALGIGTGSVGDLSSSFVKVSSPTASSLSEYTVETRLQLPFVSASYSSSLTTGSVWQFIDAAETESYTLLWAIDDFAEGEGKFILTSSDGQEFVTEIGQFFDGEFLSVAAGLRSDQTPFVSVRSIDNGELDLQEYFSGTTALSGVFTASENFDFIVGANSGALFTEPTQGFFSEARYWSVALSASELDDHALNFQSVGIVDPLQIPNPLVGRWALNENKLSTVEGVIPAITDLSRNNLSAEGIEFEPLVNPYDKFLLEYNYLSPSIDLKWTENKIRIRDGKSELKLSDIATDSNEVSLEFNLADSLNEDISSIFSTIDVINEFVGNPINKYRDDYVDLEGLRKAYFDRLGDSVHFTAFFKLFRWFDKKLSDSIKQLLPARARFIGGEQVVESHFLERPKYTFKYPVFRTPQNPPEIQISLRPELSGSRIKVIEAGAAAGTSVRSQLRPVDLLAKKKKPDTSVYNDGDDVSISTEGSLMPRFVSVFGNEKTEQTGSFSRVKISGDTVYDIFDSSEGVNFRDWLARKVLSNKDRDNE